MTFDQYATALKHIDFTDVETYPMTNKGKSILYYTMCLAVFPSDDSNDERRQKLQELMA